MLRLVNREGTTTAPATADASSEVVRARARSFVQAHPDRFAFFASVAMQNPAEATHELERGHRSRCQGRDHNGYTHVGDTETARSLDEPRTLPSGMRSPTSASRFT